MCYTESKDLGRHNVSMQLPPQQEQESQPAPSEATIATQEAAPPAVSRQEPDATAKSWLWDIYIAAVLVTTFALDQITKGWVRSHMLLGESIPEKGFVRLTHTTNTGGAFGLFPNQTALLMLASIVGITVLFFFFRQQPIPGPWLRTSLGLQLGGAAGNLVDRITLGTVTDFIDVGPWPVFNMADASIVTGLIILAWFLFRSPKETPQAIAENVNVNVVVNGEVQAQTEAQAPIAPTPDDPVGKE